MDSFCLELQLKDSSSLGCLLSLIRTGSLTIPLSCIPHDQTSIKLFPAPSFPNKDREQWPKSLPPAELTPRASAQRRAHSWKSLAELEKSLGFLSLPRCLLTGNLRYLWVTQDLLNKLQMVLETEWCHLNISSITFILFQASWSLLSPLIKGKPKAARMLHSHSCWFAT